MIKFSFNKEMKSPWKEQDVGKLLGLISKRLKINGEVEINAVGREKIKRLNKIYRGINQATDVLSFAWQEESVKFPPVRRACPEDSGLRRCELPRVLDSILIKGNFLGQIYICYPQIVRQAKEFKVPVKEEFVRVLAHGFLHIIGYDHQTKKDADEMFKLQEEIVKESFEI